VPRLYIYWGWPTGLDHNSRIHARQVRVQVTTRLRRQRIFFPMSRLTQESKGFFYRRATYKGKYGKAKEALESARAGLLPQEGDVKKKRKEKDQGR
jgi:hypothetical protein